MDKLLISYHLIFSGILIGIATSAPVGGANILCLNRAVHYGFLAALSVGLGALVADMILAASFAFGLSAIHQLINAYELHITIVGAIILLLFGIKIFFSKPNQSNEKAKLGHAQDQQTPVKKNNFFSLLREFGLAFFMTMTNPGAILAFTGIVAGANSLLQDGNQIANNISFIIGIGLGSLLWWASISFAASASRKWLTAIWLTRIHKGSGILLIIFGAFLIASLFNIGFNIQDLSVSNIMTMNTQRVN